MKSFLKVLSMFGILILICSCSQNKVTDIDNIGFTFHHSRRIPFSEVNIRIMRTAIKDSAYVVVRCRPSNCDTKWDYSKFTNRFCIDIKKFDQLVAKIISLEKIDLEKADIGGSDGTTCRIEFGANGRNISYQFWTPEIENTERDLKIFQELCIEFIKIGKLKENEIL